MDWPHGEPVTILRSATATDRHGNTNPTWISPTETIVERCAVAPRTSSEDLDGRTAVIVGLTVYMPAGTDVVPTDRLIVRGDTYEVEGEPGDWRSPFTGWRPGIEVALRRVDG